MSLPVESYCGPAALASAMGISRSEAAKRLMKHEPGSHGAFYWRALAEVLGDHTKHQETFANVFLRPTLAKWLRVDGRNAIVQVGEHFVHVKGGMVVEDNGFLRRRGRVWIVLFLDGRKTS